VLGDLSAVGPECWNDIVDARGRTYVNGGTFDGQVGVVVLVTPDGMARQVADGFAFPNGMAVTPDGGTLLVADSWAQEVVAFTIEPDGTLTHRVQTDRGCFACVLGGPGRQAPCDGGAQAWQVPHQ
jgi:sugar lactone lactonase YvrE